MATEKPRITITLEPERYALLKRLASYQEQSMSALVGELIETVAPTLERVCEAVEAAMQAKKGVRENLRRVAEQSEAALIPHLEAATAQLDMFLASAIAAGAEGEGATRVTERSDGRRGAASRNPRPVITGVRSDEKITKATVKSQKKGAKSHAL
jgi:hypothetical protein